MTSPETKKPVTLMSDAEKTQRIKQVVVKAGEDLRERHPWLKHQNFIGVSIMVFSLSGIVASAFGYHLGAIAWWACIPLVALFQSLVHELEHDLIHLMYFRKKPNINKLMLIIGWIARPSTVNPLVRRKLHYHHHKHSGTKSDLEERSITNGVPWGLKRIVMVGDNMLSILLRPVSTIKMVRNFIGAQNPKDKAEFKKMAREQRLAYFPVGNIYYLMWHGFLVFHAISLVATAIGSPLQLSATAQSIVSVLNFLAVTLMFPCFLRTVCLHFISSNMHYYGDVEDQNIMQQTQVFTAWWLAPFQLFCFNFGGTHAIHHFVVKEPFYIRQWTAPTAHKVMREMGVRFNDMGTFRRANRFYSTPAVQPELSNA